MVTTGPATKLLEILSIPEYGSEDAEPMIMVKCLWCARLVYSLHIFRKHIQTCKEKKKENR